MLNDTYRKVGERVKCHRLNRGLSQGELAEGICSRQTISLLENGQHFPAVEFMKRIADRLSVPLYEVMVDESRELEAKVQLDIIKVYVETADYAYALPLIEELGGQRELLEYQRRELALCQAECMMRMGKADQAVTVLTELQQRLELERETDDHFMANLYDKLASANYFLSNMTNAHAYYMRAYQLTLRFTEFDLTAARIAYNFGMACRQTNHQSEAIEYLSKAEEYFRKVSDMKRLAHTMFEMGITLSNCKKYSKSEEYLQHSLSIYKALNILESARRVRQTYSLEILSINDPPQAIQVLLENAHEYELIQDNVRQALSYATIAHVYLIQGHSTQAEKYLSIALGLFNEEDSFQHPHYAFVFQVYARYWLAVNEFEKCVQYAYLSSDIFGRMGLEQESAESLQLTVDAYRSMGQYVQALDMADRVNQLLRHSKERAFISTKWGLCE